MSGLEIPSIFPEQEVNPTGELIAHDHGSYRDGPCIGCVVKELGGEEITCPTCEGNGEAQRESHIDCWQCGGNCTVVKASVGTLDQVYDLINKVATQEA